MTPRMPPEILARIVQHVVHVASLPVCLRLRLVDKHFDQEVFHVLFDLGEIDRRLYSTVIKRPVIGTTFARKYWRAFLRKPVSFHKRPRHGRHSRRPAVIRSLDEPEITSAEDSPATASDNDSDQAIEVPRRDRLREVLHGAIAMQMSLCRPIGPSTKSNQLCSDDLVSTDDSLYQLCTEAVSNAAVSLLGGRDAMVYLCTKDRQLRHMSNTAKARHLVGKPSEFWALMTAIYRRQFATARTYIASFQVIHTKQEAWLSRLQEPWPMFVWKSSARERQWLEVICTSLYMAAKTNAPDFFVELLNLEPGLMSAAVHEIYIDSHNVLEQTISSGRQDLFELLIDRGWSLLNVDTEHKPSLRHYPRALSLALDLPLEHTSRYDIIRILFIMTTEWRHRRCMETLLSEIATKNDLRLGEIMLALVGVPPKNYKCDWKSSGWPRSASGEVFSGAVKHKHLEALRFLLRNRRMLLSYGPETSKMTDRDQAVGRIVERGEPVPIDCLEEILCSSYDLDLSDHFVEAAGELDPATIACFARHIDLHREPVLESVDFYDGEGALVETRSLKNPFVATSGERALAEALRNLKVQNARLLIEKFGVKLSWGSVRGLHVWEYEEKEMKALAELRELLADHGMFMETKLIYAPSFHPASSTSTKEFGKHDKIPEDVIVIEDRK